MKFLSLITLALAIPAFSHAQFAPPYPSEYYEPLPGDGFDETGRFDSPTPFDEHSRFEDEDSGFDTDRGGSYGSQPFDVHTPLDDE